MGKEVEITCKGERVCKFLLTGQLKKASPMSISIRDCLFITVDSTQSIRLQLINLPMKINQRFGHCLFCSFSFFNLESCLGEVV